MRLALIISLALIACTHPAPVAAPTPAPANAAIDYAHMLAPKVACVPVGDAAAVCDFARILAYCHVGGGTAPGCDAFANLQPREPEKKHEEKPSEAPKVEEKKPDSKPPEAKKK